MLIKLDEEEITNIFSTAETQQQAALALYRKALPDYDRLEKIEGYPRVSHSTAVRLFDLFINFDKEHHPDVMPGGLWLDCGFAGSAEGNLPDWTVDLSRVKLHYAPVL